MFEVRTDEQGYAFIPDVETPEQNRYGKDIQLVDVDDALACKSLNINGDAGIGDNPNRYKQHGFFFNADNCIGCHACESACSEKNDLPAHISFRSVGYIEGGTYPAYQRLNLSMACNHCDDPVCLKGCPTRAYTKYAEYGAVLQDPDICFGCGYCTWVCPYNAPQLDPVKGEVSKCNMCVDRLEVGLKPACAAACLGGALDFGLIETMPDNSEQMKTQIPGFPDPSITQPNIRFQQTKTLPRDMTRPDTMPLHYQQDEQGQGEYHTKPRSAGKPRQWNLAKLRSREDPLVVFTLITQAVVGAFLLLFLGPQFAPLFGLDLTMLSSQAHPVAHGLLVFALLGIETAALVLSTMHLGKPRYFYRSFYNLRYSPVSREVAAIAMFFNLFAAWAVMTTFPVLVSWLPAGLVSSAITFCAWGAVLMGLLALYAMQKIYRIKARPFWDHWQVLTSFYGSMLVLGPLLVGMFYAVLLFAQGAEYNAMMNALAGLVVVGLALEGIGLLAHRRYMDRRGAEAAASQQEQVTTFGKTYISRNVGLALGLVAVVLLWSLAVTGLTGLLLWGLATLVIGTAALVGRALFYVLVIPTTMPGAFFWKNQGFEEHARKSGLANMHQVGVVPDTH